MKLWSISIGSPAGLYATISTAPKAPIARAQAIASPLARPGAASGRVTLRKADSGRSPSSCASCSRRASTLVSAAAALMMKYWRRLVELGHDKSEEGIHPEDVRVDP